LFLFLQLVSLKFAVMGGSSAETEEEKGAAHLLSVAAFAGTTNKSGLRLMRELEDIGASVSASADREKITLDVTVMSSMAELAFERLSEAIVSPPRNKVVLKDCFDSAQLAYDALATAPHKKLAELLHEAAFGEGSAMGGSQLAADGNLLNLSPDAALAYRAHQFTANNLVIAASGVRHEKVEQWTRTYLNGMAAAPAAAPASVAYTGGDAKLKADYNGQTHLALAFPAAANSKSHNVLRTMIGNKVSKAAVEGDICAFLAPYARGGLWGFTASANSSAAANKLIESAVKELKAAAAGTVAAAELEAAKNQLSVQKTTELESGNATAALLQAHLTKMAPREAANFSNITAADVTAAAKASLAATPSWVVLGKTAGAHNFATVANLLK
jgi:predicted Zn-dependent peptidase